MENRIEVLIADDQPRARASLKALLSTLPQIERVREAVNGCDGIQLIEEQQPDLVFFDVRMPGMDGLEATRLVKARWPKIKIIVLSLYGDYASEALAAGADAFFSKGQDPRRLLETVVTLIFAHADRRAQMESAPSEN
ncbi:MAG TPA: response regulator transcription factor [Anaerolineae bacterium]